MAKTKKPRQKDKKPRLKLDRAALKWVDWGRSRADHARTTPPLALAAQPAVTGFLIAQGDSWFSRGENIIPALRSAGYEVNSIARPGGRLVAMATVGLEEFLQVIRQELHDGHAPKAILLSGGGNDVGNEDTMKEVLHPAPRGVNVPRLREIVDEELQQAYVAILAGINATCAEFPNLLPAPVPVLVHGYDYPVPDGRPIPHLIEWLRPAFAARGYPKDPHANKPHMVTVIDVFNEMLMRLPQLADGNGRVLFPNARYVNCRGTLSSDRANYEADWRDELHPTTTGFQKIAAKFVAELASF